MGRGAKAGKRNSRQKELRRMSDEAKQVSKELEGTFIRRVHPVAVTEALILLANVGCIVLHDEYGFGKKRLTHWVSRVLDTLECIPEYVTLDELSDEVIRMTGCRFAMTPEEADILREYQIAGLAKEVQLNEAAKGYWQARRALGWESRVNRHGKEVI